MNRELTEQEQAVIDAWLDEWYPNPGKGSFTERVKWNVRLMVAYGIPVEDACEIATWLIGAGMAEYGG